MRSAPAILPIKRLRELFCYDAGTGILTRRLGRGGELAGARVGTINSKGHLICRVDRRIYYVHRIAWALHYGKQPPPIIDHRNGKGGDNRPGNMRSASMSSNRINSKPSKNSRSGMRGVHWSTWERKWRSAIRVNGKTMHLGWFATKDEARNAYKAAAEKNFGEFSFYRRAA